MKNPTRRRPCPAILHNARWSAYAAAGAATALTGLGSAEAEIHYSGVLNERITAHKGFGKPGRTVKSFQFDQPGDSFGLKVTVSSSGGVGSAGVVLRRGAPVSFGGFVTTSYFGHALKSYASKLSTGQLVSTGPGAFIRGGLNLSDANMAYGFADSGNFQWTERGTGFLAFKFDSGNGPQYGWARVYTPNDRKNSLLLVDYAWGDPGDQVRTGDIGQTKGAPRVPSAGSLGWLALGGAGLLAWRRARTPAGR